MYFDLRLNKICHYDSIESRPVFAGLSDLVPKSKLMT